MNMPTRKLLLHNSGIHLPRRALFTLDDRKDFSSAEMSLRLNSSLVNGLRIIFDVSQKFCFTGPERAST
jgi:hypothetical protein